jgi:hypothetical protein
MMFSQHEHNRSVTFLKAKLVLRVEKRLGKNAYFYSLSFTSITAQERAVQEGL